MRFPDLNSQTEISQHLQRIKPRKTLAAHMPWAPAFFGLVMMVAFQTLL